MKQHRKVLLLAIIMGSISLFQFGCSEGEQTTNSKAQSSESIPPVEEEASDPLDEKKFTSRNVRHLLFFDKSSNGQSVSNQLTKAAILSDASGDSLPREPEPIVKDVVLMESDADFQIKVVLSSNASVDLKRVTKSYIVWEVDGTADNKYHVTFDNSTDHRGIKLWNINIEEKKKYKLTVKKGVISQIKYDLSWSYFFADKIDASSDVGLGLELKAVIVRESFRKDRSYDIYPVIVNHSIPQNDWEGKSYKLGCSLLGTDSNGEEVDLIALYQTYPNYPNYKNVYSSVQTAWLPPIGSYTEVGGFGASKSGSENAIAKYKSSKLLTYHCIFVMGERNYMHTLNDQQKMIVDGKYDLDNEKIYSRQEVRGTFSNEF